MGPTIQDRVLAINIIGSKMLIILVLIAFIFKNSIYLDVAILLVLLNFVTILVISRYLETYGGEVNQIER
jgi:multicomponent Na+:H+ antiporter subunit F